MKLSLAVFLIGVSSIVLAAEPQTVPAPIMKLALFKNGVCAVVREVKPVPGSFLVKEEMEPIHGTLWFFPSDGLTARTYRHMTSMPNLHPFKNLTASYVGHSVQVSVNNGSDSAPMEITGKVIHPVPPKDLNQWERNYGRKNSMNGMSMAGMTGCCMDGSCADQFLTLGTKDGERISIDRSRIISIRSQKINPTVEMPRESLLLTPRARIGGPVAICYLTKGAAWAPSYRLDLGADSKMRLSMSAVIMNELEDLNQVDVNLISGFPNIRFENVHSPMASGMTMSKFFQELSGRTDDGTGGSMMMRQKAAVMYNSASSADMEMGGGMAGVLPESGKSEDIHYRPIGKISLKGGESLYLPLDSAESTYERIVEWTIRDRRDIWGRPLNRNNDPENSGGDLWDAVSFVNPFRTPMTTAPVEITDGGKFLAQTSMNWVNPAQKTILRITKALTVTGKIVENELKKESATPNMKSNNREVISIGNVNYLKQEVEGTLFLRSYRKFATKAVIRLQFSGELISAEGTPSKQLLETGLYSINPRSELTWEIPLKAEEEVKIRYQYSVLVRY